MKKFLDTGNLIVVLLTIILFILALFLKGFSKDLLLEIGVLLVSIKLIFFANKQALFDKEVMQRFDEIKKQISELKK
jgi:c-di-AMP phosphodiesterase-like protein